MESEKIIFLGVFCFLAFGVLHYEEDSDDRTTGKSVKYIIALARIGGANAFQKTPFFPAEWHDQKSSRHSAKQSPGGALI